MNYRNIKNLREFVYDYDSFIVDLWGVLHDGVHPYPGAIEALTSLRSIGKKIVLLSNAPRRAFKAVETMNRLGFSRDLYDHLLTSGEVGYQWLSNGSANLGAKYYYIGPQKDEDILDGLKYERVYKTSHADFALTTGFDNFGDPFESKKGETDKCLEAGLPLICVNPDKIVVRQNGEVMLCSGLIAEYYEKLGGKVYYFGKPYKNTYDKCLKLFGRVDTSKIAAIGDGLHTDIAGANNMNIYSVLVTGGILSQKLGAAGGELPDSKKLAEICKEERAFPKAVIPAFIW